MGTSSEKPGDREAANGSRPAGTMILIVTAVVVIAAIIIAAVIAATGGDPVFDEGTPEATVQRYLDALIDGDEDAAYDALSDELRQECSPSDLREREWQTDGVRVSLRDVRIDGAEAEVDVTIHEGGGGGLFGEGSSYPESFVLANTSRGWVLSERPWPIFFCSGES